MRSRSRRRAPSARRVASKTPKARRHASIAQLDLTASRARAPICCAQRAAIAAVAARQAKANAPPVPPDLRVRLAAPQPPLARRARSRRALARASALLARQARFSRVPARRRAWTAPPDRIALSVPLQLRRAALVPSLPSMVRVAAVHALQARINRRVARQRATPVRSGHIVKQAPLRLVRVMLAAIAARRAQALRATARRVRLDPRAL